MIRNIIYIGLLFIFLYLWKLKKSKIFQSILITGASKGIGRTLAIEFAKKPYPKRLYLTARSIDLLQEVAEICRQQNDTHVEIYKIDVADRKAMKNMISEIFQRSPPDLVIANAGITLYTGKLANESQDDAIYRLYDVNLYGTLNTILPAMSKMKVSKNSGTLAIMSSQAANVPLPGINAYYSSSKAAISYLQGLRKELSPIGIDLAVVQPGYIATSMVEKIDESYLRYMVQDLEKTCKTIIKELEDGKENINLPLMGHYLTCLANMLPNTLRDKIWRYMPNLIMGEVYV